MLTLETSALEYPPPQPAPSAMVGRIRATNGREVERMRVTSEDGLCEDAHLVYAPIPS